MRSGEGSGQRANASHHRTKGSASHACVHETPLPSPCDSATSFCRLCMRVRARAAHYRHINTICDANTRLSLCNAHCTQATSCRYVRTSSLYVSIPKHQNSPVNVIIGRRTFGRQILALTLTQLSPRRLSSKLYQPFTSNSTWTCFLQ